MARSPFACTATRPPQRWTCSVMRSLSSGVVTSIPWSVVAAYGARSSAVRPPDRPIGNPLDAFENVARRHGPLRRPRIEHCSIVDDDLLRRIRAIGAVTLPFAAYTRMYGGKLVDWYGEGRVDRMFAVRDLLDGGVPVGGSTDHPCAPMEPLNAIQAMVTRQGATDGVVAGARQRVTVNDALCIYTRGSAFAEEAEHERGRLAPGLLADFIVLEHDPRDADPHALGSISILATVVGAGRCTRHPAWSSSSG